MLVPYHDSWAKAGIIILLKHSIVYLYGTQYGYFILFMRIFYDYSQIFKIHKDIRKTNHSMILTYMLN